MDAEGFGLQQPRSFGREKNSGLKFLWFCHGFRIMNNGYFLRQGALAKIDSSLKSIHHNQIHQVKLSKISNTFCMYKKDRAIGGTK